MSGRVDKTLRVGARMKAADTAMPTKATPSSACQYT